MYPSLSLEEEEEEESITTKLRRKAEWPIRVQRTLSCNDTHTHTDRCAGSPCHIVRYRILTTSPWPCLRNQTKQQQQQQKLHHAKQTHTQKNTGPRPRQRSHCRPAQDNVHAGCLGSVDGEGCYKTRHFKTYFQCVTYNSSINNSTSFNTLDQTSASYMYFSTARRGRARCMSARHTQRIQYAQSSYL